ncbi:MAG TPA: flagellar biosynthesis anti-sigma factor FlgM [Aquabacterium sp.]|uniref:flagellar biosynthesis anti-sigma factor FlgM n=1 Tax=Aquabacterium sp. TaxID=1872578 RepID=UPI002E2F1BCC|nr:flagellar biosynthesis anti-sigma factor FlgM [Aquabacterium sp.]HEX5372714.1 flagellar biosynthesis anti-sigma factor FlgM [Aquabacterium sp.]
MKIGNTTDTAVNGPSGGARTEGTTSVARPPGKTGSLEGGPEASAKVSLSTLAGDLMNGADASFDAEKVSRVKQAIEDGSYKINPEAIADKLIANAQEVLARKTS